MHKETNNINVTERDGVAPGCEVLSFLASCKDWTLGSTIIKQGNISKGIVYRQLKWLKKMRQVEVKPASEVTEYKRRDVCAYRVPSHA